ncbi:MAG: TerB family tellurite resistance protein [Bacteroidales bacterium]|nr:TerB family tellurite resistance protein [Bacteroidales bacterium]
MNFTKKEKLAFLRSCLAIASADKDISPEELDMLDYIMYHELDDMRIDEQEVINFSPDESKKILKSFSPEKKELFKKAIWNMAWADGYLHKNEELYLATFIRILSND